MQVFVDDTRTSFINPAHPVNVASCSPLAASSWPLGGELLAPLIGQTYAQPQKHLRLVAGVHYGFPIVSMPFTYTPAHVEDGLEGAVNILLSGDWKVWHIVPLDKVRAFKVWLRKKYGKDALFRVLCKRLRPVVSAAEMQALGIKVIFQPPGYTVVTMPGEVIHWTVSMGFSLCEASNFFSSAGGLGAEEMFSSWTKHAQEACSGISSSEISAADDRLNTVQTMREIYQM